MAWGAGSYGFGTFGGGPAFTVLDTEIMSAIQLAVLEPDDGGQTWPSGLWSKSEVVTYINNRQRDFLRATGLTVAVQYQAITAGVPFVDLPQDLIDLRRLAYLDGLPSPPSILIPPKYVELARADGWELDNMSATWPTDDDVPQRYMTAQQAQLQMQLQPIPTDVGELEATYVAIGQNVDGNGTLLSVPDDWTPYLIFGVLADMLSSEGEAQDSMRAAYCESRWNEGIDLAEIALAGAAD